MASEKKKFRKSVVILLVVLAVLVSLFAYGTYTTLQATRTKVFVFNRNFDEGTVVTGDMFGSIEVDTSTYNLLLGTANAYALSEDINMAISAGDRLAVGVVAGLPVTTNLFMANGGSGVESRLADGKVAVEILASKVNGLSGNEVRVGSRINVTAFSDVNYHERSELVYQDMMILEVVEDEDGNIVSIYVECEPADVVMLQHALVTDTVSISILKPGSYEALTGDGLKYERNIDKKDDPETLGMATGSVGYWNGYLGN